MTNSEFSDNFDILYNNITSNKAPGLNEHEKSVFLTLAQDDIIKAYFNAKSNKTGDGFDDNEKRLIDFSMIMATTTINSSSMGSAMFDTRTNNKTATLPRDIMMFINERINVTRVGMPSPRSLVVVPISYDEYSRLMSKPFQRPLKNHAWRLLANSGNTNKAELIVGNNDTILSYSIRYIKKPRAIILQNLEGVTLDGISTALTCELDPILHEEILKRAVELAKAAFTGNLLDNIILGLTSSTNLGTPIVRL